MPEYQPVSSVHLSAIERPGCPACNHNRMLLSKLDAGPPGFDHRTFECQKCGRVETTVVASDPHDAGDARMARRRTQAADLNIRNGPGTIACFAL